LVATVAIVSRDTVIAEYTTNLEKTHSQTLLPMIDEIFKMTGLDKKNLKAVAVTNGPGSFTGLRIGAATAKGITLALNIPIISIPTLEATAYNMNFTEKLICPIMDARRHQVYTGIFRCKETTLEAVMPSNAMALEDLLSELNKLGEEVVFIGDGIPVFKDEIDKGLIRSWGDLRE
jgi:tRNA threonylcarbamoyladenosine biosynthesis protein TsaB